MIGLALLQVVVHVVNLSTFDVHIGTVDSGRVEAQKYPLLTVPFHSSNG